MTEVESLLGRVLKMALTYHASDIHMDPVGTSKGIVRMRVDHTFVTVKTMKAEMFFQLLTNVKVKANMDISEHTKPLDGLFSMIVDGRKVDMRVGIITGIYGQKAALRILAQVGAP